jgi:hypothetical protein
VTHTSPMGRKTPAEAEDPQLPVDKPPKRGA